MTTPFYPSDEFPELLIQQDGFGRGMRGARRMVRTSSGHVLVRRQSLMPTAPMSVSIGPMGEESLARLERFWAEDTAEGTRPFLLRNQIHDGKPVLTSEGEEWENEVGTVVLQTRIDLVQWGEGEPVISVMSGELYRVQASLLVLPS